MTTTEPTTEPTTEATTKPLTGERADLLETLAKHRHFLRFTTRDLTDEQAGLRTTVSELCLGGLIKHTAAAERNWTDFIVNGPSAMGDFTAMTEADWGGGADRAGLPDSGLPALRRLSRQRLRTVADPRAGRTAGSDRAVRAGPQPHPGRRQ